MDLEKLVSDLLAEFEDHEIIGKFPEGEKIIKIRRVEVARCQLAKLAGRNPKWVPYAWLYRGCPHYLGEVLFLEVE